MREAAAPRRSSASWKRCGWCSPRRRWATSTALALYPATSSHRALTPRNARRIGIGDGLVRLSVGIEDPADIVADLAQALAALER